MTDILTPHEHFPSVVYSIEKSEYLDTVRKVSQRYLALRKKSEPKIDSMYPVQTNGYAHEPDLAAFTGYIAQAAWTILSNQGHDMENLGTYIQEMWTQEHNQYNGHDEHIHNRGAQITGMYILDCPEDTCTIAVHDPRHGKNQINIPEADLNKITLASSTALFIPKPGMMYFFNSWLPHSVTRNPKKTPFRLVHFNLGVRELPSKPVTAPTTKATVI
ncbi:Conserved hypothetical protein CHP02466 [uncultured Caudovirales phage]|uniref:Uncharacterized protein n=1 Tax=uncultured Caudovirales phage TaxID=2100421 RepID=A0A6J5LJ17_9CAUD|nr:Conserved hypothetical protein CHP02466 [uncultured Caudovirales phage]